MLRHIKRFRLTLTMLLSCLIATTYFPYLSNIYAKNNDLLHSITGDNPASVLGMNPLYFQEPSEERGGFKVGVKVDLVMMYTSVFDKEGHFIRDLEKESFNVYEDGARQEIAFFSQENVPISLGIVLDLSGSMSDKIDQVTRAARSFIEASTPDDEVFLIGFDDEVELLQSLTNDIDEITDALDNAPLRFAGTALYDAIYLGVEEAQKGNNIKKAIVVITDGEDKDSLYTLSNLVSNVQESDVQVFNIGFIDEIKSNRLFGRWFKSDAEKARDALERISEESGGKAYFPEEISEIHDIVSEIAADLRNQYSIGYFSSNEERDGSWRRVVIKINSDAVSKPEIRHRRGYYAPK